MNDKAVWEKYVLARHNINLTRANVVDLKAIKHKDISSIAKISNELDIKESISEETVCENKLIVGLLNVTVNSNIEIEGQKQQKTETVASVNVVIRGIFEKLDTSMSSEDFIKNTKSLIVPLLLPYARVAISNASVLMDGPHLTIPSMDVIRSLSQNQG